MGLSFCSAVFSYDSTGSDVTEQALARMILGRDAAMASQAVEFDECLGYLFPRTERWPARNKGVGVSMTSDRIIVVSDRCVDWLSDESACAAICAYIGSNAAIHMYIDTYVDSAAYILWSGLTVSRALFSSDFKCSPVGVAPPLERQLCAEGLSIVDVVDGVAQLLLSGPFTQVIWDYAFDLWV